MPICSCAANICHPTAVQQILKFEIRSTVRLAGFRTAGRQMCMCDVTVYVQPLNGQAECREGIFRVNLVLLAQATMDIGACCRVTATPLACSDRHHNNPQFSSHFCPKQVPSVPHFNVVELHGVI